MKSKHFFIFITSAILLFSLVSCQDSEEEEDEEEYDEEVGEKGTKVTKAPSASTSKSTGSKTSDSTTIKTKTTENPDDEEETSTQALDYIFNPVSSLLKNVEKGNITGIVDMALSIRTPPAVRELVNGIMQMIFGAGQAASDSFVAAFVGTTSAPAKELVAVPAAIEPAIEPTIGTPSISVDVASTEKTVKKHRKRF